MKGFQVVFLSFLACFSASAEHNRGSISVEQTADNTRVTIRPVERPATVRLEGLRVSTPGVMVTISGNAPAPAPVGATPINVTIGSLGGGSNNGSTSTATTTPTSRAATAPATPPSGGSNGATTPATPVSNGGGNQNNNGGVTQFVISNGGGAAGGCGSAGAAPATDATTSAVNQPLTEQNLFNILIQFGVEPTQAANVASNVATATPAQQTQLTAALQAQQLEDYQNAEANGR